MDPLKLVVLAVAIVLLANGLSAQNAAPCVLHGTTYPCTIGGTLLLPTAPTGNLFGGGGGGGGGGGNGGANSWFLTDPTNPGFALEGNKGNLLTGTGPGQINYQEVISENYINGAQGKGASASITCGVTGAATLSLSLTTPAGPIVLNCPKVASLSSLETVIGQASFAPVSSYATTVTISGSAPTAGDSAALFGFSFQTSMSGVSSAIPQSGVVPIDGTVSVVQSGSWISIYGTNLAATTALWNGDFPTSLGGATVVIDGNQAYLWYVSPTQINAQVPDDTNTGAVNVVVNSTTGIATSTVVLGVVGPALNLFDSKYPAAVIPTPSGSGAYGGGAYDLLGPTGHFAFNTRPVKTGEVLELFGVGFGPTNPQVPAGKIVTGSAPTINPVSVSIGGVPASVQFAGIVAAGQYQINVVVPSVPSGDQPLQVNVQNSQAPSAFITVQ